MGRYRPGTLDDAAVNERRRTRERRTLRSVNQPTGSQVFETTQKVRGLNLDLSAVEKKSEAAYKKAEEALAASKGSDYPVGCLLHMTNDTNPSDIGIKGIWVLRLAHQIPMSDVTEYIFERIEDDNDI